MTTNQTIDGVPLLPCPFCGGEPYGTHDHYVHDDLSPMPCVECRSCSAHLKAEDWNRRVQPAAQPQGEPVAYADPKAFENFGSLAHLGGLYSKEWMWASPAPGLIPLYAEQPAQKVKGEPDAIIEGVMTSVGITHAIYASTVSLKHGEQVKLYAHPPAPVAVVLPERKTGSNASAFGTSDHGYNTCIDDVARLNTK